MANLKGIHRDKNGRIPQVWTVELAVEESKKYNTKKDFRLMANSAYQYLVRHKSIDLVCLPGKRHRLNIKDIFCALKKSKSWSEFRLKHPKEYTAFCKRRHSIPESEYSHLGISKTAKRWTENAIRSEAKKYYHKSHFCKGSPGAYDAAIKYGILRSVCSHMKPLQSDFNCVYMWVAKRSCRKTLVKFGVTSKRLGFTRINFVEKKSGYKAIEVFFSERSDSLDVEATLKAIGTNAGLSGFSGASEFFWLTDPELKKAKEVIGHEAAK